MKILKLEFQNINSLEGTTVIDFESPEYTANGIFLITGPTGAGKTSIFDAMCLALYGRTPRMKINASGGEDAQNEVLTRGESVCSIRMAVRSTFSFKPDRRSCCASSSIVLTGAATSGLLYSPWPPR